MSSGKGESSNIYPALSSSEYENETNDEENVEKGAEGESTPSPSTDLSGGISATAQVIKLSGRYPLELICPYCQIIVMTEVQRSKSQETSFNSTESYVKGILYTAAVILAVFFIAALMTRKWLLYLGLMTGFLIVFGILFIFIIWINQGQFEDVKHNCPQCRKELGVSLGADAWKQEYQRRNNRSIDYCS